MLGIIALAGIRVGIALGTVIKGERKGSVVVVVVRVVVIGRKDKGGH